MSRRNHTTLTVLAFLVTAILSIAPIAAQQQQQGLVNVAVGDIKTGDILSNNTVQVAAAVNVVATVCGTTVTAAVLSDQLTRTGSFACKGATQFVRITQAKK